MRKITTAGIVLASALLFACQKEQTFDTSQPGGSGSGTTPGGSTTSGSLLGTWKFLGLEAQTQNTAVGSIPGLGTIKTVTYSKYTTEQNTGLLKFDDSKMTGVDLAYSINTTAKGFIYENNVLTDSLEMPISFAIPPTNSVANYKKIGNDSLHIESGSFVDVQGSTTPGKPGGYKYKIEGDKLILSTVVSQTKSQSANGVTETITLDGTMKMTLQRQ